jgi:hypothetical protein
METSHLLQLSSLAVFCLSLGFSVSTYLTQQRHARRSTAARLHELWCGNDLMEARTKSYDIVRDFKNGGTRLKAMLDYILSGGTMPEPPERRDFSRLIAFFTELEACLDTKLADPKLCGRFFGSSHFYDYWPAFEVMVKAAPQAAWAQELANLEKRFRQMGVGPKPRGGRT